MKNHPSKIIYDDAISQISDYLGDRDNPDKPVQTSVTPEELRRLLSFDESRSPHSESQISELIQLVLRLSTRTGHPHFATQMYSRTDLVGMAAEFVLSVLNTNVHTYDVSPVLSTIERLAIEDLGSRFGFSSTEANADGVFVPGGTTGTLYALHIAKHKSNPDLRRTGMNSKSKLVAFCSQGSHYSFKNSAILTGIGTDNMREVPCDSKGRMLPRALEEAIKLSLKSGEIPFFVGATAGTTIMGAFDPLPEIAAVAKQYALWLHVDAAWGGAAQFSPPNKHLLNGLEDCDSMIFNIHKMLGAPLQCSLLLTHSKHGNILTEANSVEVPYLFQDDRTEHDVNLDIGKKTFQCGRRGDAIKYWLMKHALGETGLEQKVDNCVSDATKLAQAITKRQEKDGSFILHNQIFSTTCFWYVPEFLRPLNKMGSIQDSHVFKQLHTVAPKLKTEMLKSNKKLLISYASMNDMPNFFRWAFSNSPNPEYENSANIENALDGIEQMGLEIFKDTV